MPWQTNLREISKIVYRLKRNFGLPALIVRPDTVTHDVETGEITKAFTKTNIRRAVLLPKDLVRRFVYDTSLDSRFKEGGFFDQNTRTMLIDAKDVPVGFEFTLRDHVEFDGLRYEIRGVSRAEDPNAYLLSLWNSPNSELSA